MGVMTTIAIIGAATAIQAAAQKKAGNQNARMAREQATDAMRRGVEDESAFRREVRTLFGTQRAGYAGQNVDVTMGTPQVIRASGEQLLQSDLARIRRNAEREAHGYTLQEQAYRSQGNWGMFSTILGGASEAYLMARRHGWTSPDPDPGVGGVYTPPSVLAQHYPTPPPRRR